MFVCPVPKISKVMLKWRRRAAQLGIFFFLWHNGHRAINSVDLLCVIPNGRRATQLDRFTLWHNGRRTTTQLRNLLCVTPNDRRATQLGFLLFGTMAAELHSLVDLLCGTTAAELNNRVSMMHAPGVTHIFQKQ